MYSLCAAVEEDSRKCPVGVQLIKTLFTRSVTERLCENMEMYRRRITVYINNGKAIELKERKTIKSLYEELEDEDFVQIHSGGIVNVKYIYEYSGYSITLDNETKLVVSRSRMKEVKEQMARYWRNRV